MAVDVVYAMFPVRVQHILHIVTYAIFLVPFLMGLVPASWTFFLNAYTTGEQTYSVWAAPTWPVKLCLFVGLVLPPSRPSLRSSSMWRDSSRLPRTEREAQG